jgi:hypothetical protein
MDIREVRWGGMYWISLAQDRNQLRALMKTVGFHKILGSS